MARIPIFWQNSSYLKRRFKFLESFFTIKIFVKNDQLIIAVILRPILTIFMENHILPFCPTGHVTLKKIFFRNSKSTKKLSHNSFFRILNRPTLLKVATFGKRPMTPYCDLQFFLCPWHISALTKADNRDLTFARWYKLTY